MQQYIVAPASAVVAAVAVARLSGWHPSSLFERKKGSEKRKLNLVAVMPTFFSSTHEPRFIMFQATLRQAARCGTQLVVVDASVDAAVRAEIHRLCPSAVVVQQDSSIGTGKGGALRQGISIAITMVNPQSGVIAFLEPEKTDCIRLLRRLANPIKMGELDVVLPKRSPRSMRTLPVEQFYSENYLNRHVTNLAKEGGLSGLDDGIDWTFGPVLLHAVTLLLTHACARAVVCEL